MSSEIIITIITVYIAVCILIGIWAERRSRTYDDYLVAGRKIGKWLNGIAYYTAMMSATGAVGVPGLMFVYGIPLGYNNVLGPVTGGFIATMLVAWKLRLSGKRTIAEFLSERYDSRIVRIIAGIIVIIGLLTYSVPQLIGAGLMLNMFTGIDYLWCVILVGSVFIIYVALGGMWATTLTDAIQGALMLVFCLGFGWYMMFLLGGPSEAVAKAVQMHSHANTITLPYISFMGLCLSWTFGFIAMPNLHMRIFASQDEKTAKRTTLIGSTFFVVQHFIGAELLGIAGLAIYAKLTRPDQVVYLLINDFLPPAVAGLMLAGLLAAMMSTLDSFLLACGASLSNDIVAAIKPATSTSTLRKLSILGVVIIGALAILFSLQTIELIMTISTMAAQIIAVAIFWPIVLGMYWKRTSKYGVIASMIISEVTLILMYTIFKVPKYSELFIPLIISAVVLIIANLLSGKKEEKRTAQ
ncbi:MAG: sodium:solute symporter family protein [Candidatus Nezhaarchaeota archaeon]|nr:sodium:solute symporter family protein [Candidatus Nezhaarchaeota archaeon]